MSATVTRKSAAASVEKMDERGQAMIVGASDVLGDRGFSPRRPTPLHPMHARLKRIWPKYNTGALYLFSLVQHEKCAGFVIPEYSPLFFRRIL